jgi:hypothetical protein
MGISVASTNLSMRALTTSRIESCKPSRVVAGCDPWPESQLDSTAQALGFGGPPSLAPNTEI